MEEIRDHFAGDWKIVSVHGYSEAELNAGEPAQFTFWEDGTGLLTCAGVSVAIEVDYGETLEGMSSVTFKGHLKPGEKRASVSGLGAIQWKSEKLEGSVRIGGRARAFVAERLS